MTCRGRAARSYSEADGGIGQTLDLCIKLVCMIVWFYLCFLLFAIIMICNVGFCYDFSLL